jgi:hypothetical protein
MTIATLGMTIATLGDEEPTEKRLRITRSARIRRREAGKPRTPGEYNH